MVPDDFLLTEGQRIDELTHRAKQIYSQEDLDGVYQDIVSMN